MNGPVVVAVSAFRSNAAVIDLLKAIFAQPHPDIGGVIVVDSLGDGEIADFAVGRNWPVLIENHDTNIGSAGNLARRMELASQAGAEWCLCLNHDANWDRDRLDAMLRTARSRPRVGAVYPVLDHSPREPRWQEGNRDFWPSSRDRISSIPSNPPCSDVLWGISNFALYATAPLDEGVAVMGELWMGFEDLAYGIALHQAGWNQVCCRAAVLPGAFDYVPRQLFGRAFFIPDKPAWLSYYSMRNLLLIRRRYGVGGVPLRAYAWKFVQSILRTVLLEDCKVLRVRFHFSGLIDGAKGRRGKGAAP